ncbi:hypothetical protein DPMN_107200 [Dreissena polymorpha]|uniref:Uncharacterized protein n=1 Tax=Dreissena polymorpha TaxID=45954 RepID=A0A9D4K6M5_DREPO|nr:hypothetical protein DPMN_107200 [Dreissena polymorpha]
MWYNKFHCNLASRVKDAPLLAAMFFQATGDIFELSSKIVGTSFLIKFHEDRIINVSLTKQMLTTHDGEGDHKSSCFAAEISKQEGLKGPKSLTCDTKEPTCSVQPKISLEQNVLTKFHEEKNIHPTGSHVFVQT